MTNDPTTRIDSATPIHHAVSPATSEQALRASGDASGTSTTNAPVRASTKPDSEQMINHQLVNQTKSQIRNLVQEISELSKSECSREEFFEGFLTRVASALASVGGAIWIRDSADEPLQLHYQINMKQTGLPADPQAQVQHSLLLNKLVEGGEPNLILPHSGASGNDEAANPTEYLLVIGPLVIGQQTVGLVEIFQRPAAGPTTQRGYLRFLMQMCEIAGDFLCQQRLRAIAEQQLMWQKLEHFIRTVHQSLDTENTVYTIANESRRLIDCDRVSVALARGHRCRIKSVSGLDSIERRAEQVKILSSLATKVIRAGQPLWYNGDDSELPPQIERKLHDYIDKSHSKMLAIIPLKQINVVDSESAPGESTRGKPIGALIVEQLKDSQISPTLEKRVEVVVEHSEMALTNSVEHNSIFLMPLWKAIGRFTSLFRGEKLVKTTLVACAVALVIAILCWFPYPFSLGAKGALTPEVQHEVFAQVAGVLQEIHIEDGSDLIVEAGQKLATMSNNDLRVEIENLEGELNQTRKQMETLQFSGATDMEQIDGIILSGEFEKAREKALSIERRLQIKLAQASLLEIRAPARGRVVNWQVRQNLLHRPVSRGQNLMTIIDPETQWQIELEMPERRVSHLLAAMRESSEPLQVNFTLVSHPGREFAGQLLNVDQKLDVHSDDGNSALVRIAFDNAQVDAELLRSGTRVTAKVECGERPVGYVIFHELIETVQSSLLFWF